jgi:hypothetical protein
VEFRNDTQMQNEVPNAGARSPNMSGLTEPEDPDYRVHAAWLAQASNAGDGPLPKEAAGGASELTSSLARPDRLGGQEAPLAPAQVDRRSGLITKLLIGCILATAIAAVIAIPPYLQTWQEPTGDPIELTSPDRVESATPPMQKGSETPKLVVEPTLGAPGEPAPIGLALRGRSNDAVVILRGLAPGMELSAGSAVSGDSWQLSATDLPYAWIAPPKDFVGSADLVAELRLPNAQIADRQTLHVKWGRAAAPAPGDEQKHEQLTGQKENNPVLPTAPATVEHPTDNEREAVPPAPPISAHPRPGHLDREEAQRAPTAGRSNVRRSSGDDGRGAPVGSRQVRDRTQGVKGFWDWSR